MSRWYEYIFVLNPLSVEKLTIITKDNQKIDMNMSIYLGHESFYEFFTGKPINLQLKEIKEKYAEKFNVNVEIIEAVYISSKETK